MSKPRKVGRAKAERTAAELLDKHHPRDLPIPVEDIARNEGLAVVYEYLAHDTSAVLVREPSGERVIGVNAGHSYTRQRFSVAHELGHALLHMTDAPSDRGDAVIDRPLEVMFRDRLAHQGSSAIEVDANAFAAAILMPEDLVVSRLREAFDSSPQSNLDRLVDTLARDFGVSPQAMRYRLINLHLLDPA